MRDRAGQIRVLHVDDEPEFSELAGQYLEREDDRLDVAPATDVSEGLDRLDGGGFDCVVSDYDMPGRNGIEFLETVREEYGDVPFILYTGKGSEEIAADAISAGVTEYLQKERGTGQYAVLANRITNAVEQHRARDELEMSQQRLSMFFEQSPLGVIEWTEELAVVRLNDAAEDILGYAEEELVGETWEVLVPDSERKIVGEFASNLRANHGRYQLVNDNVRKDGELITCEWHNHVVTDDDGAVVAIFSQFQDVTDREERERDLKRERDRIRAITEAIPDVVIVYDSDGRYVDALSGAKSLLVADPDALEGATVDEVLDPEVADVIRGAIDRTLETGTVQTVEYTLAIDGEKVRFEARLAPLRSGESEQVLLLARDVTDRTERERELQRKKELLEAIFEFVPIHLFIKDRDGRHLWVSGALYDDPDEWIGKRDTDVEGYASPEYAEQAHRDDMRVVEQGEAIHDRIDYNETLDRWFLSSKVPWRDEDGEIIGLLGYSFDITERKEREQALERQNEKLTDFVSTVSHDLRNPLDVAVGRLELAQDECDSEHLDAVEDAHERMRTLIGDLLARAQDDGTGIASASVALADVVGAAWRNVETEDATLVVETTRSVEADPYRLQQLLENLVRNAVEHGGSTVCVRVGDLADGDGFYVEDDGPGIPDAEWDAVFEPQYSTDDAGSGLGLNIVAEIVDAHDWRICVADGSDGGARFEITGVGAD